MNDVLDQRSDDEVIIRCNCGSDHFVTFSRAIDGEEQWAWANVVAEYRPHGTLWGRVKMAAHLIRKGCPWTGSIGLTPGDFTKIEEWCARTREHFTAAAIGPTSDGGGATLEQEGDA